VEIRWVYDGVPLRICQAGVRAKGGSGGEGCTKAKGVSWSSILVNPSLRLLIRRTPLGGIVATARLGSECLWRRTPLVALNELDGLMRRMWGRESGRWQVSYAHLAHDVANAPLQLEQLERFVSRSRRRALFEAAQADMERLRCALWNSGQHHRGTSGQDDLDGLLFEGWWGEEEYADDEELLLADPSLTNWTTTSWCSPLTTSPRRGKNGIPGPLAIARLTLPAKRRRRWRSLWSSVHSPYIGGASASRASSSRRVARSPS
jgi:hypothetical protein